MPAETRVFATNPHQNGELFNIQIHDHQERGVQKISKNHRKTSTPDSSTPGLLFIGDVEPMFVATRSPGAHAEAHCPRCDGAYRRPVWNTPGPREQFRRAYGVDGSHIVPGHGLGVGD